MRSAAIALVLAVGVLTGCESGVGVGPPPPEKPPSIPFSYSPANLDMQAAVGETVSFVLQADTVANVFYRYYLNGELVSLEPSFPYLVFERGVAVIRGEVFTRDNEVSGVTWTVDQIGNYTAPVSTVSLDATQNVGEFELRWIAAGSNAWEEEAASYQVKSAPQPIVDESVWSVAVDHGEFYATGAPGDTLSLTVGDRDPGALQWVVIRARDAYGHVSPLGSEGWKTRTRVPEVSGYVFDSATGDPAVNVLVTLGGESVATDAAGAWQFLRVLPSSQQLLIQDEVGPDVGGYYDAYRNLDDDRYGYTFALLPNRPLDTTAYATFLDFYLTMTQKLGTVQPSGDHWWSLPIPIYVPPLSIGGLDYREEVLAVVNDVNQRAGFALLAPAAEQVSLGVNVSYPNLSRDFFVVDTWDAQGYPIVGSIKFRTVYTAASSAVFYRVVKHEIGHALGLNHSTDPTHLMVGGVAPQTDFFSTDEWAVILAYCNARGTDSATRVQD